MPAGSAAALRPLFSSCAAAGATLRFFGETIADGIAAGDLDGAPEGILDPRLIDLRSPSAGAGDGTSERREAATRTFDRHRRQRLARMLRDGSDDVPPRRALVLIAAAAGPEELGLSRVRDARTLLSAGR